MALTLGSTRRRLIEALHDLGLYREALEARRRDRELAADLLEAQRLARSEAERRRARERLARRLAEERAALALEHRRFVLLLRMELAYASMTEVQRTADRFEEQVLTWLNSTDPGP